MKKIVVLALALIMLFALCACGASDEEKAMYGTYTLYAMDYDENTTLLAGEMFGGDNYITLKSGGSAEMCMESQPANVKWKADGNKLTFTAADGDMEGKLSNGILSLVVDGTNLYYVADGASTDSLKAITLDEMLNGVVDDAISDALGSEENAGPAEPEETEVQKLWNGWWYGAIDINGCTNGWDWLNGYTFDIIMLVELDEDGYGSLSIYEPYGQITDETDDHRFALLDCHADTNYLYGDSGMSFNDTIKTSDWIFVRNMDNHDKINMGSSFTDADNNRFGYDFTFMPWGSLWEGEEDYTCFIPFFEDYIECVEDGQIDPYGNYEAAESPSGNGGSSGGSSGSKSALLGNNPKKLSINDRDIVFVYYPGDKFEYDDTYGKIKSKNGSVSILFDPMLGSTNYEEYKTAYKEKYSSEDDYSLTETTVNGYKAMIMKYSDWLDSSMYVDVDFGGSHGGYYGMCFNVTADSLDECDTDLVWAIIESFELAK